MTDTAAALTAFTFAAPLPGFAEARTFVIEPFGDTDSVYQQLTCVEQPTVGFIAVEPHVFFPDYDPDIPDDVVSRIGLTPTTPALVLVLLSFGASPTDATANLLGPIVINCETGEALQAVLSPRSYSTREPLVP